MSLPKTISGWCMWLYFLWVGLGDTIRELKRAEKKIRIEESFLGELGISAVALHADALVKLGHSFQAKIYLEPILVEPDLLHEQKIILYYTMGLAEQALEDKSLYSL